MFKVISKNVWRLSSLDAFPANIYLKSTEEALEKGVKYVQS